MAPHSTRRKSNLLRLFLTARLTASAINMPKAGASKIVKNPMRAVIRLPKKDKITAITNPIGKSAVFAVSKTFC